MRGTSRSATKLMSIQVDLSRSNVVEEVPKVAAGTLTLSFDKGITWQGETENDTDDTPRFQTVVPYADLPDTQKDAWCQVERLARHILLALEGKVMAKADAEAEADTSHGLCQLFWSSKAHSETPGTPWQLSPQPRGFRKPSLCASMPLSLLLRHVIAMPPRPRLSSTLAHLVCMVCSAHLASCPEY